MPAGNPRNRAQSALGGALQQSGFQSCPRGMFEFEAA